jgi:crossover junction endodeoxyribonuclease RuvC
MRILGIDPGLGTTGYGLIEVNGNRMKVIEAGSISTAYQDKLTSRLQRIRQGITSLIKEQKPKVLVLENLYSHYKHPTTAILMGHARGVICLTASENKLDLVNFPAKRIRKALTGNGNASKEQTRRMVANYLGLNTIPGPLDVSDALALAVGYVRISGKNIAQIKE